MTAFTITGSQISASEERGSVLETYVAGEALTVGQAVYLDSSNPAKAYKALADTSAHALAVGMVVAADNFYAETTIQSGGQAVVCVYGPVFGVTGLTLGEMLWVDKDTAGAVTATAPTSAYQYALGHMQDNDVFFVDPGTTAPVSA